MYERIFTVAGTGPFPFDVAAREGSVPAGDQGERAQGDTEAFLASDNTRRVDMVIRHESNTDLQPDAAAWTTAGWNVVG